MEYRKDFKSSQPTRDATPMINLNLYIADTSSTSRSSTWRERRDVKRMGYWVRGGDPFFNGDDAATKKTIQKSNILTRWASQLFMVNIYIWFWRRD